MELQIAIWREFALIATPEKMVALAPTCSKYLKNRRAYHADRCLS
jgi:hypothetical protein